MKCVHFTVCDLYLGKVLLEFKGGEKGRREHFGCDGKKGGP